MSAVFSLKTSIMKTNVFVPGDAESILIMFLFSKFTISASFLIIYPFAGELYPTSIRGLGIGASAYIAGLGLIIIPFINYLVGACKFGKILDKVQILLVADTQKIM